MHSINLKEIESSAQFSSVNRAATLTSRANIEKQYQEKEQYDVWTRSWIT
ncbi:hypothetical protein [Psychrobacillus sp. MER TA 171]|nr:hypothetical protein [Psychrobacillus sp. MER TA 171]MCM3359370.1 hypothetical protein [Psychrobacillus sp. MER TA 171]